METIKQIEDLPELGTADIQIWGAEVPRLVGKFQCLERVLCVEERAKAARFLRAADRNASVVARGALRILLAAYSGDAPERIRFGCSENGKPFHAPPAAGRNDPGAAVAFNVSHSGDWVVLAFGRNRQVGVDVEKIRRDLDVLKISGRYFTVEETALIEAADDPYRAFFHHWARKEAYVKAVGSGLFRELSSFSVPDADGEKDGWFFQRLEAGSAYASAVVSDKPVESVRCFAFQSLELS